MSKNDQREAYEKLMSANHSRMIDLVKFGEAKNAVLLTFCSVWIGSILTLLRQNPINLPIQYEVAFKIALILLFLSAIISIRSFLPRFMHHFRKTDDTKNLLYFGNISELSIEKYGKEAKEKYLSDSEESYSDSYLSDLEAQVAIQARIADRKFKAFNLAGWIVLSCFGVIAIPLAIEIGQAIFASIASVKSP